MLLGILLSPAGTSAQEPSFAGGTGTRDDPYLIETAEQLDAIRNNLNRHYKLINDIDLSDYDNWEPIGTPSNPFTGVLDGNNCTIRNLNIDIPNAEDAEAIGLFGAISAPGIVHDLSIEGASVRIGPGQAAPGDAKGVLAGWLMSGAVLKNIVIKDAYLYDAASMFPGFEASSWAYAGGVVGISTGADLENITFSGMVMAEGKRNYMGGLAGAVYGGRISNVSLRVDAINDYEGGTTRRYVGIVWGALPDSATDISNVYACPLTISSLNSTRIVGDRSDSDVSLPTVGMLYGTGPESSYPCN